MTSAALSIWRHCLTCAVAWRSDTVTCDHCGGDGITGPHPYVGQRDERYEGTANERVDVA